MSTPVGHSLLGIVFARIFAKPTATPNWHWYAFAIFAANAADLDFLAGAAMGDLNLYHQGPSHSILAALLFGCAAAVFLTRWLACKPLYLFATSTLLYASHLLLDYFREDSREPFGLPLMWPVTDQHWISSFQFFRGIVHGVPGDSPSTFINQLFTQTNLYAIGIEVIILFPITLVTVLATRKKWSSKKHVN